MTIQTVEQLTAALAEAKKSHKADKSNAELKKAYKAAKAALAEAQEAATKATATKTKKDKKRKAAEPSAAELITPVSSPVKKQKVDVAALKSAMKSAKKAYKADKSNADLKKKFNEAKAAFEAASASESADTVDTADTAAEEEVKAVDKKEAEVDAEDKGAAGDVDMSVNPDATPKLFLGNLSFDIDDDQIKAFFADCGEIVDIYWLEDKESGKFKGCGFITFESPEAATKAYGKNGQEVCGRDIKIDFAKPKPQREGGNKFGGGNGGAKGGRQQKRELSARPDNCVSVFCGNLSYEIDDDKMKEFASNAGCGDVKAIRWLSDRDTGDFKGCGFVEFYSSECVDAFVKKNGEDLMGRSIRIDYAAPRPPRN